MTTPVQPVPYAIRKNSPRQDGDVSLTVTLPADKAQKLYEFMASDTWERANALREATLDECLKSVAHCLNFARRNPGTAGGRVFASCLASLYNGDRVKVDLSDVRRLDSASFEHLMNSIRLCFELNAEPHTFFENGGRLWEKMIEDWGLEKKRRAR